MLNQATIIGRLGRDPEVRFTPAGMATTTLSVATDDSYKDKQGQVQKTTDWHKVVVWDKSAEACGKWLAKGSLVAVTGKIKSRSYENKEGVKVYVTEIRADRVQFLDSKKQEADGGKAKPAGEDDLGFPVDDDNIPF